MAFVDDVVVDDDDACAGNGDDTGGGIEAAAVRASFLVGVDVDTAALDTAALDVDAFAPLFALFHATRVTVLAWRVEELCVALAGLATASRSMCLRKWWQWARMC